MSIVTISPLDSIQEALNKFNPKEKSVLKLLPGLYEEDVEFPANVTIEGSGVADLDFTVIRGTQTFPQLGSIAFNHVKFESASSCFISKPDSDFLFLYRSCVLQVDKGYPLYIPQAKGNGIFFDCCVLGNHNGFINNRDGKVSMRLYNMTSQSKDPHSELVLNNSSLFFNVHITHKVRLCGNDAKYDIQGGSWFEEEIFAEDTPIINIGGSQVDKPHLSINSKKDQ